MIDRLVLLGATGDLAGRFLLPALATLTAAGDAPSDLRVVGAERFADDVTHLLDLALAGVLEELA